MLAWFFTITSVLIYAISAADLVSVSSQRDKKSSSVKQINIYENRVGKQRAPSKAVSRAPAGLNPKFYELYRVQGDVEFWTTTLNRCDDTQQSKTIPNEVVDLAIANYFQVFPKIEALINKIESTDKLKASLVKERIRRLAVLFDPADSVVCTGEVGIKRINGEDHPILYLSLTGASVKSWNTVIPHELAHLFFSYLGLSSEGLEESWADLLAISVNNYRPYIGEGDGRRAVKLKNSKLNDPNTSKRSKIIYKNWCSSPIAFRDFSQKTNLENAYLDLEGHNISCHFVKVFLDSTSSSVERDQLLFGYLFSSKSRNRKYFYSSQFAKTMNELLNKNKLTAPADIALDAKSTLRSKSYYSDQIITLEFALSDEFRSINAKSSSQPLVFEVRELQDVPLFLWTSSFFSSGERELSRVDNCDLERTSMKNLSCACFKSGKIIGQVTFLNKSGTLLSATASTKIRPGCYMQ